MNKKLTAVAVFALTLVVVVLSGCGNKTPAVPDNSGASNENAPIAKDNSATSNPSGGSSENLPTPTGKVDDTVNAIIDGADKEGAAATSDDNDAKSATASNSQAVDDIGQGL